MIRWLPVALLVLGCGHESMREFRISSDFPDHEIEMMTDRADAWCKASDDLCLPVSVVEPRRANVLRLRELPRDWKTGSCGAYAFDPERPRVEFNAECDLWPSIIMHEFGHALRSEPGHIEDDGHLLSSWAPKELHCVTQRDADFVCRARGCREWHGTCPESGDSDD